MILERILLIALAVVLVLGLTWGYVRFGGRAVDAAGPRASRRLTPLLFVGPAIVVVCVVLLYPAVNTVVLSLFDADGERFVGLANYGMLGEPGTIVALRNTLFWVIGLPLTATAIGLLVAVLTDRVRYGGIIKAALFLPIAISAVAAGVIWKFVYDYKPAVADQTGTLNGLITFFGANDPVPWLIDTATNNPALIATAVWTQAGFAMVIFSAALRGIPEELYEAAALDGSSAARSFFQVTLPLIVPTVTVVLTTMAVVALKAFDIIYVMTNGSYDTDVIATLMYKELFSAQNDGRAGALATILMLAMTPIMIFNIRQYRAERKEDAR